MFICQDILSKILLLVAWVVILQYLKAQQLQGHLPLGWLEMKAPFLVLELQCPCLFLLLMGLKGSKSSPILVQWVLLLFPRVHIPLFLTPTSNNHSNRIHSRFHNISTRHSHNRWVLCLCLQICHSYSILPILPWFPTNICPALPPKCHMECQDLYQCLHLIQCQSQDLWYVSKVLFFCSDLIFINILKLSGSSSYLKC